MARSRNFSTPRKFVSSRTNGGQSSNFRLVTRVESAIPGRSGEMMRTCNSRAASSLLDMVGKRAIEIAMIDERDPEQFTDADWEQARRELLGVPAADAPEEPGDGVDVPEEEREIVPESPSHRAPRAGFDEDESLGETLVSGGLEEAAHDQMLEARREEQESEES